MDCRRWSCRDCRYEFTAPVEYGQTPSISGELRQQCPKCNSRSLNGTPIFSTTEESDEISRNAMRRRHG